MAVRHLGERYPCGNECTANRKRTALKYAFWDTWCIFFPVLINVSACINTLACISAFVSVGGGDNSVFRAPEREEQRNRQTDIDRWGREGWEILSVSRPFAWEHHCVCLCVRAPTICLRVCVWGGGTDPRVWLPMISDAVAAAAVQYA